MLLLSLFLLATAHLCLAAPTSTALTRRTLDTSSLSINFLNLTIQLQQQGPLVSDALSALPSISGEAVVGACGDYLTSIDNAITHTVRTLSVSSSRSRKRQVGLDSTTVANGIAASLGALLSTLRPLAELMATDATLAPALDGFMSPVNTNIGILVGGVVAIVPSVLHELNIMLASDRSMSSEMTTLGLTSLQSMGLGA